MPYMKVMVEKLEQDAGLVRNTSLRAATYDFRKAGDWASTVAQFEALQGLVEETYEINEQLPVHLLSHSLGGAFTTAFLNLQVSEEWKEKYVASFINLSGPLLGTPITMAALLTGPVYVRAKRARRSAGQASEASKKKEDAPALARLRQKRAESRKKTTALLLLLLFCGGEPRAGGARAKRARR
jgi:alpha-beta hydrolase superfamily lysophospholipase